MLEVFLDIPLISFSLISMDEIQGFLSASLQSFSAFDFGNATNMMTEFAVVESFDVSQKQGITSQW